jgi:hypothetical protein
MANKTGNHHVIHTNETIIEALEESNGLVYLAAEKLNMSHSALQARIKRTPELTQAKINARKNEVNLLEHELHKKILEGDWRAIEFGLRKIGRDEGYGDVTDVNMNANVNATLDIELEKIYSLEELKVLNELASRIIKPDSDTESDREN